MFLHEQDFKGLLWDSFTPGTGYVDWLFAEPDVVSAYEYQRRVLQVLQSGAPGWWNLKMPSHSIHLPSLLEVFPDALLVWAHRDPFRAIGSLCNLLMLPATMTLEPDAIDKEALGQNCKHQMREHLARPLQVRERIGDDRFFDLHYADLLRDQLKVLDATAVSLCMENDLPIVVFDLNRPDNITRVAAGEPVGTLISGASGAGGGAQT
jgi:hypothetical protein